MFHSGSSTYSKRSLDNDKVAYRGAIVQLTQPSSTNFQTYGQDATSLTSGFKGSGPDEGIIINTDGHGEKGHFWSFYSNTLLVEETKENWWDIKRILRKKSDPIRIERATELLKQIMSRVEDRVTKLLNTNHAIPGIGSGGTTASVTAVMIVGRKRTIIQFAVGDSPMGIYDPSTQMAEKTVTEANGDSIDAVNEFLTRYRQLGYKDEDIPKVVFNRFNTGCYGSYTIPTYTDANGLPIPIPAYIYGPDGAIPNVKAYKEHIQPLAWYGTQSRNKPPIHEMPDGTWAADEGHEAENFGNSCSGTYGQNLTGIGDLVAGMACACDASVHIREGVNDPMMVFAMSDGLSDIDLLNKICKMLYSKVGSSPNIPFKEVGSYIMQTTLGEKPYRFIHGYPTHDDVSVAWMKLRRFVPPFRRRK